MRQDSAILIISQLVTWGLLMSCTTKQANQESVGMNCPTIEAQPILAAGALLGEGAFWHHQRQQLWWIDIEKGLLHLFTPASNSWQTYSMGKRIGTVVPDKEGNAIVALQDGIFRYNFSQQTFQLLAAPEKDKPQNRFNDGKCDPVGRLWAGTMAIDGSGRNGALYCLEGEGKITKKIDSVGISNGIVWTSDSKQMYYIDTPTGQVCAYDYDAQTGQIRFSKVAVEIPQGAGYPDGMAIDSENMIWVALWEGGGVMRFNPKTGKPLLKVITPGAWRVTSCAFGGEHLNELYITTASIGLTQEQKKQYPNSGHVFKVTLQGIKGVPMPIFAF